jgi:hypothetical protein
VVHPDLATKLLVAGGIAPVTLAALRVFHAQSGADGRRVLLESNQFDDELARLGALRKDRQS